MTSRHQNPQTILPQNLTGRQRAYADLVMDRFMTEMKKEGADMNSLTKDTPEGTHLRATLANYMGQADIETAHFTMLQETLNDAYSQHGAKNDAGVTLTGL